MSDYGMLFVLIVLCLFLCIVTYDEQQPSGMAAAEQLATAVIEEVGAGARALVVAGSSREDVEFADTLEELLTAGGITVVAIVKGQPLEVRQALDTIGEEGAGLVVIACTHAASIWTL